MKDLIVNLRRIDGRGYGAYKSLKGEYYFDNFRLCIDHVQGDPFAAPSRIALVVGASEAGLPDSLVENPIRRIATEDAITRRVSAAIRHHCKGSRGSGKSGRVTIDRPGQEVLERSSCLIDGGGIEVRIEVGLPAAGRRVLAREAEALLCQELPALVQATLMADVHDIESLTHHADVVEDQQYLRGKLTELGLVAFVADGAILPRRSGVDDRPLVEGAVAFSPVPDSLAVTVELPHAGIVRGLGIPKGVTLIVGGGYHGKSTLLEALTRGIYDHIPGDGRECVVTSHRAVSVRAEDGRSVTHVGIEPFIGQLPNGVDTRRFSTDRASGSTSQAAAIMEALEAGADTLLVDEDTSASNFLVRDHRMQALVPAPKEPIRPFVDRVSPLFGQNDISTVLVLGGSSDYFEVADTVIHMDAYQPLDVMDRVQDIMNAMPSLRATQNDETRIDVRSRIIERSSLNPNITRRPGKTRVKARSTRSITLGDHEIDISLLNQVVDASQTRAIADLLVFVYEELANDQRTLAEILGEVTQLIKADGLTGYCARGHGNRAGVRALDLAQALNRHRALVVLSSED